MKVEKVEIDNDDDIDEDIPYFNEEDFKTRKINKIRVKQAVSNKNINTM